MPFQVSYPLIDQHFDGDWDQKQKSAETTLNWLTPIFDETLPNYYLRLYWELYTLYKKFSTK